jgi:outer membrane receptor protein involved in Fe transport
MKRALVLIVWLSLLPTGGFATVFGTVRVIVHDPQHRPIRGSSVTLKGASSAWSQSAITNDNGMVEFTAVPVGAYEATVTAAGFVDEKIPLSAISGRLQEVHAQLRVAAAPATITVSGQPVPVNTTSSTPQAVVSRADISRTPGADRVNSLSFITAFVPGSYVVHNQLHTRGGHPATWALDGVPLPNTNIASNVGPQFDPKDADYVEAQRGAYSAEYGDRTYGVFNVVPRSGFERSRQGELLLSYGSYNSTDNQLSFGDHTARSAYYLSFTGNRSDYGLETPTAARLHDQVAGGSGFTSLQLNLDQQNQLRFVGAFRGDFYQVPNDPAAHAAGVRDREREQDGFATLTYAHTFNASTLLTISPFYHFNRAAFEGGPLDVPIATDNRASTFGGGQMALAITRGKHNVRAGLYAFAQHDNHLFGLIANDGSGQSLLQRTTPRGDLEAIFLEDQYRPWRWLTLNLGVRTTRFSGDVDETSTDPRLGVAITAPRLGWVLRAAYARFYQAPPLSTISGPLLQFAVDQGFDFIPLKGERDEQHNFGITIPVKGWAIDADYFRTGARNFFDHDALGNSNIFLPLTIDHARIRGTEIAVRAPRIFGKVDFHLAYSHQTTEGQGGVTGGLTDFSPTNEGLFFLDHDQRHTLSTGFTSELPMRSWFSSNVSYGSGFLNGDGPDHLPAYYTLDLALGKSFGENVALKLSATNVTNQRYFIDLSNTFGGSHFSDPRQFSLQLRYRFHY